MTEKAKLRHHMLKIRQELSPDYMKECSELIAERLIQLPQYQEASLILFYMPFRQEVDVRPAMEAAWKAGKKVALPRVRKQEKNIDGYVVNRWEELQAGAYGILEPPPLPDRWIGPDAISLVVAPGVAFDRQGFRLGYGGGYYDRFFAHPSMNAWRVAVAYPEQIVATTYPEAHDFRMHLILTPHEAIVSPSR